MAWENAKVENLRLKLVSAYAQGKQTMTGLCKEHGISRKTAYKWYQRYLKEGFDGLRDRPRIPKNPNRKYSADILKRALSMKEKFSKWGAKKILIKLKEKHPEIIWPSQSRLYKLLKANGYVKPRRLRRHVPATNPLGELNQSNDVWIVDFKGWFLTQDHQKCEPLTITDAFSRYLIKCIHLSIKDAEHVWEIFEEAFKEFGLPKKIRTDNGPPFGSTGAGRLTKLSINLIKVGITPEWINPGCPQENGRHERFHLTLQQEIASPPAKNLKKQLEIMRDFEEIYNLERPHESLGMKTPASIYTASPRKWDGKLKEPKYDRRKMVLRKVTPSGCIWLKGVDYYIGTALEGEYVGLYKIENGYKTYYGPHYLGEITKKGFVQPKRKVRKKAIKK